MAVMVLACIWVGGEARGYEIEVTSRTTGQAYTVRWYRLSEADRLLYRRRLTQTLGLEVWDILKPTPDVAGLDPPPPAPFQLYVSSQLRIDHDFGTYTRGSTTYGIPPVREPATTAVPELRAGDFGVELMYGLVGARGIGGVLDAEIGRQIIVDSLDWYAFDGLHARLRLPLHLAVEGQVGLLVRDGSPIGFSTYEPDGTSDAQCQAFSPDSGTFVASPDCPQRTRPAPTFGFALATDGLRDLSARVSYRRTTAPAAAGVYPDIPDSSLPGGVLEEKFAVDARARLFGGALIPWAAARWNLLLGLIDQAHAGARFAFGEQAVTLEALYSYPSFDGDSIFNVFLIDPYWDVRATWDVWPGRGSLRGYLRGYYRHFTNSDDGLAPGESVSTSASAAGAGVGGRWDADPGRSLRLDLYYEDGYGGLRAGGDLAGRWQLVRSLGIEGRVSVVRFAEDSIVDFRAMPWLWFNRLVWPRPDPPPR